MHSLLIEETQPGVVYLTLNRPEAFNALDEELLHALLNSLHELQQRESLRVVVLAANGRAFCAGHDLKQMRTSPSDDYYRMLFGLCGKVALAMLRLPVPIIARVQGTATAAGCQLVAGCDLAFAADHAKFAVSGVNLGLFCSTPAVPLSRNVNRKQAMKMLLTGDFIDANEAVQQGLINAHAPMEQLDALIQKTVDSILAKPKNAVALGKDLFYRQHEMGVEAAYQLAVQTMAVNMMLPETLEGVQAFIDKRKPNW